MPLESADIFHLKDLYIDVELEAFVDNTKFDLTGKKLFSTKFYSKNIGFGITDIDITISTSLMPLIEITFKDLYGNAVFGTKRGNIGLGNEFDYSILLNWPPPKFVFSFKGFLGRKVTWILNLKKQGYTYNPGDGSYDIKCSFVPNQWGFFADLPFLYLLAVKRLKKDDLGLQENADAVNKLETIYDLIKIGQQVDVSTQETTKEFDGLRKQVGAMQSNISRSLIIDKLISFDTLITGDVAGLTITTFKSIKIPTPTDPELNTEEKRKAIASDVNRIEKLNTFLLLSLEFGGNPAKGVGSFSSLNVESDLVKKSRSEVLNQLDQNAKEIEDAIKAKIFKSSKSQLSKITISKILSKLAGDSAYIIGKILEEGINGYEKNKESRDSSTNRKDLIGKQFPLKITSKGEEVPATSENGVNVGVDTAEMAFVNQFILALTEGAVNNKQSEDDLNKGAEENKLRSRINNLEILQTNPYKPSYKNIATNILVRSGIIAFLTRSSDPNLPGDYNKGILSGKLDRDSVENVRGLAKKDIDNITDNFLNQLSTSDILSLKRFVTFFDKFFDANGEDYLLPDGTKNSETLKEVGFLQDDFEPLNNTLLNLPIVIDDSAVTPDKRPKTFEEVNEFLKVGITGLVTASLNNLVIPLFSSAPTKTNLPSDEPGEFQEDILTSAGTSYVDPKYLMATKIVNNTIPYFYPELNNNENQKFYVIFKTNEATEADSKNSSPTDTEFKSKDKDESEPLGIVPISGFKDSEGNTFDRVKFINDQIRDNRVIDYNLLQSFNNTAELTNFLWTKPLGDPTNLKANEYPAEDLSFTVYSHRGSGAGSGFVFTPFFDSPEGRNQRACIKEMCSTLRSKLDDFEKNKNDVVSSVLGKSLEQKNLLYKQMHTIYHNWETLAFRLQEEPSKGTNRSVTSAPNSTGKGLAKELEKEFGGSDNANDETHVEKHNAPEGLVENFKAGKSDSNVFIYDFPLQSISDKVDPKVNVKNSIINTEPLYKPDSKTTVLNMIDNICRKNNFMFLPFPGDGTYDNIKELFKPFPTTQHSQIKNYFHVLFTPTPETRSKLRNDDVERTTEDRERAQTIKANAININFGAVDNQIVRSVNVSTEDSKMTVESIVNTQRLVDNENQNKTVTTDCSMLSVYEGRSYKASCEVLGNAQIYPMQYFYLNRLPLFEGLYQIMSVKHSIKQPNNMDTHFEGIRMRLTPSDGYGAIYPITIDSLEKLTDKIQPNSAAFKEQDIEAIRESNQFYNQVAKPVNNNIQPSAKNGGPIAIAPQASDTSKLTKFGKFRRFEGGKAADLVEVFGIKGSDGLEKAITELIAPYYLTMQKAADDAGIRLRLISGFRTSEDLVVNGKLISTGQITLYNNYKSGKGNLAAPPGSSNHQSGFALDLNHKDPGVFDWLVANAYKYGFVRKVVSERWHWEYRPGVNMFAFVPRQHQIRALDTKKYENTWTALKGGKFLPDEFNLV